MKKVLTALSGGVDSAVTAGLLRELGYGVGGATMLLRDGGEQEAEEARKAAEKLDIPFHLFSWKDAFQKEVIDPFTQEYQKGNTPNPCVFCNKALKFGLFLDKAMELGYDAMATGHYARVCFDETTGLYQLKTAKDQSKDQTYMLYGLTQEQLSKILLPLGDYTKPQARELAGQWNLPQASKHDSQDICFVPDGDYMAYLVEHGMCPTQGQFRGENGENYGAHKGFEAYTIGQRRGLDIAAGHRIYVVDKQYPDVVIGAPESLLTTKVEVERVNWISGHVPEGSISVAAKLRYTPKMSACTVTATQDGAELVFQEPQRAVTSGQSAVFYDGDVVLGGGIITRRAIK